MYSKSNNLFTNIKTHNKASVTALGLAAAPLARVGNVRHINSKPIMIQKLLLTFFTMMTMTALSEAADSPIETVSKFYSSYLAYDYKKTPNIPRPKIDLSSNFSSVVNNTEAACKKFADYPCGWGADGDEYLDSQESDPDLTYKNSGIVIAEAAPGVVKVKLNVYPSIKDAGDYYLKSITYKMVKESGRWVVDDVMYSEGKSTKLALIEEAKEAERLYNEEHPRKSHKS